MSSIHHIPAARFTKGTWRNGRGVSWDIASEQPFSAAGDFGWRFAIAEIAISGPFSLYGPVDRVFTLIEGDGVELHFAGGKRLVVDQHFKPHHFACDIATDCVLPGGVSRALNLFVARDNFKAEVDVITVDGAITLPVPVSLLFALQGDVLINGTRLSEGDAAEVDPAQSVTVVGKKSTLYVASLKDVS